MKSFFKQSSVRTKLDQANAEVAGTIKDSIIIKKFVGIVLSMSLKG